MSSSLARGAAAGRPLSADADQPLPPPIDASDGAPFARSPAAEPVPPSATAALHAGLLDDGDIDADVDVERQSADVPDELPEQSLLPSPSSPSSSTQIPAGLAARLYTSHFLSTWNSRLFEFAAVLFLAAIFPDTLLPLSVYAVARGLAAMVFAEAVGTCIDRGDRLAVVRVSIIGQRAAVVVSCGVFGVMLSRAPGGANSVYDPLFAVAVLAACAEKLCSVMNLVAVERDWVVVMTEGNEEARRELNARIRRIDLFCKLVGPLAISFVAAASTRAALWTTLGMSAASVVVEYFCIAVVYRRVPALRRRPAAWSDDAVPAGAAATTTASIIAGVQAAGRRLLPFSSLPFYFRHPAFLPSFSLAILYLTVLSFSGQMVTFLLAVGYSPLDVGLARTVSTVFELSATWLAPRLMARIGAVRGGIWSLSWQALWLAAATAWFFGIGGADGGVGGVGGAVARALARAVAGGASSSPLLAAAGLAVGVALSRVGLWGYDLCAQSIVQDEVADAHRGAFSTAEAAFQNLFEVLAYATTIAFPRPDQFRVPVALSVAAVYAAAALYAAFVRRRRGHLFHSPQRWLEKAFARPARQRV